MLPVTDLLTPWYRRQGVRPGGGVETPGSVRPTRILDHDSEPLRQLIDACVPGGVCAAPAGGQPVSDPVGILRTAHTMIGERVRPVYSLDERVPGSRTLRRGAGSCSQRLAILESVARGIGIPTRVRGLEVDRAFWRPRFPLLVHIMPHDVMLAWPEFRIDGEWVPVSELFATLGQTLCLPSRTLVEPFLRRRAATA